ncbi:MAG TPA: TAXI family TRAP transporter solute-binding subunit [Spirochaetia bacterium]|nr:TAXI family TRAP transporter solute-binding subunit [Spirochaetales bacterium]HRY80525.1 TAXI family TRAP transporter solute-binding subunit [Spirochaetia bacterium]
MTNLKKGFALLAVAALVLLAACAPKTEAAKPAAPTEVRHITMGTAGVGGSNYPTGIAMSALWNANIPGVKAVAIATGGSPHNIDLLRTKDADVAVCRSLEAYRATNGIEPYKEKMPWLRSLTGGLFTDVFQVVAVKASGIKSVADFKGKRIVVGPVGSGGEVDARETLAAYGLTYEDMKVSFVEFAQGIDMMKDGLADAGIIGLAMGASGMQELLLDGKVGLIPITDEALANLRKKNEFLIRRNIPANTYPNQPEAVPTVGTPPDIIIVRDDMPEDLVYQMTKTLYTNLPAIHAVSALLTQFTKDLVLPEDQMLIPYHPGAKKYFVEMGWLKK